MSRQMVKNAVDRLGHLRAEEAELKKQIEQQVEIIKREGVGAYEGNLFRATVSESVRNTLDMGAVRDKLSPQFIAAHTSVTTVVSVKVAARSNENMLEPA